MSSPTTAVKGLLFSPSPALISPETSLPCSAPCFCMAGTLPFGFLILSPHYQCHLRYRLLRQEQGLHLLLPSHCSDTSPWLRSAPPSHAKFRFPWGADHFCVVYCSHSHAKSPHLQPDKQGDEGSSEKNLGEVCNMSGAEIKTGCWMGINVHSKDVGVFTVVRSASDHLQSQRLQPNLEMHDNMA